MKKIALALLICIGFASLAQATDLTSLTQASNLNNRWAGLYAGVTGGYGFDGAGKGINGGALLGFNYQPTPWLVTGAEADLSAGANGWMGTVRGRLGVPVSSFLVYGTGGLAYGGAYSATFMSPLELSDVSVGWAAGAGVEYALTQNWSVRGEWLYYDLGQQQVIGNTARLALTYKF